MHPDNVVVRNGRAEVLKVLGRLPEALAAYEETARLHPENVVARNGRAEVLKALGRLPEALVAYEETARMHPDDAVVRTGRAEVLKALGRLPEALAAYEETARMHPDNVVVRNGRAEVLKALGCLPEALAAYEETARRYPENPVTRNGMAHILVRMREWDRALALLPEDASGREDWVGLHIRGMLYLRRGQFDAARTIFERGVRDCPFVDSRDFFRTALVMTSLRQNRPQEAAEELKAVTTPALATPARVLQLHAYGAMGDVRKAKRADDAIPKQVTGVVLDLRLELERRYIQKKPRQHDDAWVFEKELDMLADYALAA
jgi:tetratricopeptide (TPR) repeat protein